MLKLFKKKFNCQKKDAQAKLEPQQQHETDLPRIVMHSFSGSKEIAQSLAKLSGACVYFSFCQIKTEVGCAESSGRKKSSGSSLKTGS